MTITQADDRSLQRVSALACRVAGTSMAAVASLDGNTVRLVGTHGFEQTLTIPAAKAVAALGGKGLVIEDIQNDPRFVDHPLRNIGIRFLCATPVRMEGDELVGALFVMDRDARPGLDDDQVAALVDLATMVSERIELRRVLARSVAAEAEALAISASKRRVTSRLSHDLRTPMTAILGFGQLLRLEKLSDNGTESVDHLLSAARKLLGMIDEVLDLNRLDQGEHEVALEVLSLADVLDVARVAVRSEAERLGVAVAVDSSCEGLHVRSDRRRLQQIAMSLLGNILERASAGSAVRIKASEVGGRVRVTIADDRSAAVPGYVAGDGTRDGLTLSKRLMEAMDGDVGAEADGSRSYWLDLPSGLASPAAAPTAEAPATPARGAAPSINTPVPPTPNGAPSAAVAPAAPEPAEPAGSARRTLLYVEDDPANQRLVTRMFARVPDVEVVSAMDGRTGLDLARTRNPGVVLLDLGLPDISGREVLAGLKADHTTAGIPVVVLSGEAEADRPGELQAAGAAAYVTKPFNVRAMLDLVGGLFEGGAADASQ